MINWMMDSTSAIVNVVSIYEVYIRVMDGCSFQYLLNQFSAMEHIISYHL